jgi:hypothetical protein
VTIRPTTVSRKDGGASQHDLRQDHDRQRLWASLDQRAVVLARMARAATTERLEPTLVEIDEERVREWLATMIEVVEADEIAPKTVNNARICLSVALNKAVRRGLIPRNPCDHVPALPPERREIDYLRLAKIEPCLEACRRPYRALAEFLIGTVARVSKPSQRGGPIARQRPHETHGTRVTRGKRFRSVQIGPRLAETLQSAHTDRLGAGIDDGGWIFLSACAPEGGARATVASSRSRLPRRRHPEAGGVQEKRSRSASAILRVEARPRLR